MGEELTSTTAGGPEDLKKTENAEKIIPLGEIVCTRSLINPKYVILTLPKKETLEKLSVDLSIIPGKIKSEERIKNELDLKYFVDKYFSRTNLAITNSSHGKNFLKGGSLYSEGTLHLIVEKLPVQKGEYHNQNNLTS